MLGLERQRSDAPQAGVLRLGAENLQFSQILVRSADEVAQFQARCNEIWRHPEAAQCSRDEVHCSLELELDAHGRKPARICCYWWWWIVY